MKQRMTTPEVLTAPAATAAGGTFPWLIGRLDYAIGVSPTLKHMKQPASAYLRRFHYDLITHNPQVMRNLIDLVGVDRIVTGTDFPQGMSVNTQ